MEFEDLSLKLVPTPPKSLLQVCEKLVYRERINQDEWEEKIIKFMNECGWKLEKNTETLLGFGFIQDEKHWMRDYDKKTRKFAQYNGNEVVNIKVSNEKD